MKKLFTIALGVSLILALGTLAHAQDVDPMEVSKDITVSFDVTDLFGLQVWSDDYVQDLDDVIPGGTALGDIHIYATSNHGVQWYINAESMGVIGTTQVLPVVITTFDGIGEDPPPDEWGGYPQQPTGSFVTDLQLTGAAATIYTAASSEFNVMGLQVGCVFTVPTTIETMADSYTGSITLTMTE